MTISMAARGVYGQASRISIPGKRSMRQQQRSVRWRSVRIVKSVRTKVCVDGSLMKEYLLDEPLTENFLEFLKRFGTVRVLGQLRRPYFSFEKEHFVSIKGFVGDPNVEVRFPKVSQDLVADYFHLLLFYERQGAEGIGTLEGISNSIREKIRTRLGCEENDPV
jgi:hypothetical protein